MVKRGVCACRRSRLLATTPVYRAGELLERAMELWLRDMLLAKAYLTRQIMRNITVAQF
jgi:hypothetical protein